MRSCDIFLLKVSGGGRQILFYSPAAAEIKLWCACLDSAAFIKIGSHIQVFLLWMLPHPGNTGLCFAGSHHGINDVDSVVIYNNHSLFSLILHIMLYKNTLNLYNNIHNAYYSIYITKSRKCQWINDEKYIKLLLNYMIFNK